jgi:hypothetical protein
LALRASLANSQLPLSKALYITDGMRKLVDYAFYFVFGFTAFNWAGWPIELRFSESHINYYFITLLCVLLPVTLFFKLLLGGDNRDFLGAAVLSALLGAGCFVVGIFAYTDANKIAQSKIDYSFEKVDEIQHDNKYFRLYRTNGGATTSFGLVLREESKDFLGLKVVNRVFSKYKASEGAMKIVDQNIELEIQPYSKGESVQTVLVEM